MANSKKPIIIDSFCFEFVIDFIVKNDRVILLHRTKEPWKGRWNGVGGHIETGETPSQSVRREVQEEVDIDLDKTTRTFFTGILTWETGTPTRYIPGMFIFVSTVLPKVTLLSRDRKIDEGILAWKPLSWACDKSNTKIADNVPYFLPIIISSKKPQRYHCVFANNKLGRIDVLPFPDQIVSARII